ncbi:hypothetical protein GCM10027277_16950 [Pseudoduganella ginsengisoli]|uniref:Uncharacterized protein n=1 Tax=Pseudoduganella ginsengisoli TaxID=1462440 RepID=A0A6L6PU47_9BURK|nr:hypothetical protein [Pseudoduganella ginsengisoli]MTW01043.1 hypothetical protein [Pseudoduganella ginsengisoli]
MDTEKCGPDHIDVLDKKITALSDALAHLGKGESLKELLRIIRFPGYTTPAEFAFTASILDGMAMQIRLLETTGEHLLAAAKQVGQQG